MPAPDEGRDDRAQGLQDHASKRYDDFVEALRAMVNVDCGSFTPEGVNEIADRCQQRFEAGGWKVERMTHAPAEGEERLGDLVIGRLAGAGTRVLMIGHTDTVFDAGIGRRTALPHRRRPCARPRRERHEGRAPHRLLRGRGAAGGGVRRVRPTYVCNPDEEIGSPWSHDVIQTEAANADVAFVLEGARENGDIVSSRKGVSDFRIEIEGRAAHAPGRARSRPERDPRRGAQDHRRAGAERHVAGGHDQRRRRRGGTRANVIPERCVLEVDVRSPEESTFAEAQEAVRAIANEHTVADVKVTTHSSGWHRPMEKGEGGTRLVIRDLDRRGARLRAEGRGDPGGASDANTTSAAGVPTLDGLGPIGGDDHGPLEWLDLRAWFLESASWPV